MENVLSGDDVAFGDGPGAEIAVGPEGTAGVGQQDFKARGVTAVKQQSGAVFLRSRMGVSGLQSDAAD